MRIAVTGAAGFIGRAVVEAALARGHSPVAVVRSAGSFPEGVEVRAVGDLRSAEAQAAAVAGCEAVIHLAGRVKYDRSEKARADEILREANAVMTANLAEASAKAGVRRFVHASSLSIFGSATADGVVVRDDSPQAPVNSYGRSKQGAERMLAETTARTGLSAIALRPPAVYGPGVASSFTLLMKLVERGLPLPLANVENRRSFIYSENLAGAFVAAAESDATGAFIVADSQPLSSRELVEKMASALGVKARLVPAPVGLMRAVAKAVSPGVGQLADSLFGSMAVDGSRFTEATGWRPAIGVEEALARTAQAYRAAAR